MKRILLAFGVSVLLGSVALAQSPAETDLYEKLTKGPDSIKAVESVLKKSDEHTAVILFVSAQAAFKEKRLEDSGFLFYAAQLRVRFDDACFPPQGKGSESPLVLHGALAEQIGGVINPAIMAEPKVFAKANERIKAWSPKASKDYHPGYEFLNRKTEKEAHAAVKVKRDEFVKGMSDFSTLLNDADYFAAFRIVQKFNSEPEDKRPTEAAFEKAMQTMKKIEKDKGLKGLFSE